MLRRLFTLASALWLLLWLAAVVMQTGSWWRGGRIFRAAVEGFTHSDGTRTEYLVECLGGHIGVGAVRDLTPPAPPVSAAWVKSRRLFIWRRLGFSVMLGENISYNTGHWPNAPPTNVWYDAETYFVECPFWVVIALGLPLPVISLHRHLQSRRALRLVGCCKTCGYDLRATPNRCPECGAACKAADPAGVSPAAGD